ncbi:allantoate deiminase 2 [Tanacetum coccineum]
MNEKLPDIAKIMAVEGREYKGVLGCTNINLKNMLGDCRGKSAGMNPKQWTDGLGNVHGRIQPPNASNKALLLGFHLDTVVDARMFDGALGVISAISALKVLNVTGRLRHIKHPVETSCRHEEAFYTLDNSDIGLYMLANKTSAVYACVMIMYAFDVTPYL